MSHTLFPLHHISLTAVMLFFVASGLFGQRSDFIPPAIPPADWSTEIRFGLLAELPLMAIEVEFHPLDWISIDAGFFPIPVGGYGGATLYPFYPLMLQIQFGNVAREFSEGLHDAGLLPDYYLGCRGGIALGRGEIAFVSTVGLMTFVQHDHCLDCYVNGNGNVVRRLGTESVSRWSFELGAGLRL